MATATDERMEIEWRADSAWPGSLVEHKEPSHKSRTSRDITNVPSENEARHHFVWRTSSHASSWFYILFNPAGTDEQAAYIKFTRCVYIHASYPTWKRKMKVCSSSLRPPPAVKAPDWTVAGSTAGRHGPSWISRFQKWTQNQAKSVIFGVTGDFSTRTQVFRSRVPCRHCSSRSDKALFDSRVQIKGLVYQPTNKQNKQTNKHRCEGPCKTIYNCGFANSSKKI